MLSNKSMIVLPLHKEKLAVTQRERKNQREKGRGQGRGSGVGVTPVFPPSGHSSPFLPPHLNFCFVLMAGTRDLLPSINN